MLRLSPERIVISLAPAQLAVLRLRGRIRPRVTESRILDCDPETGSTAWSGALAALQAQAAALTGARAEVTIVLSNHFARYLLIPHGEKLSRADEQMAYMRFHFARVHGERSGAWELRATPETGDSCARVASAIDAELTRSIRACFPAQGRMRLVSVQPYLMSAFNHWRSAIGSAPAWLALVEPGRTCLCYFEHAHWSAVRNLKGTFYDAHSLAVLLGRERRLVPNGASSTEVLVRLACDAGSLDAKPYGWRFRELPLRTPRGLRPSRDPRFELALSAA